VPVESATQVAPGAPVPPTRPSKVVADLDFAPGKYAGDLRVKGEIAVPKEILQPTLARIATQLTHTTNAKVEFNPQTGNFEISGNRSVLWGLWKPPFKLELKPITEEGKFGFKVVRFDHPGPSLFVDTYFLNKTAACTTEKGYPTTYDSDKGALWVDADTVVHRWTHLSPWLHVDFTGVPLAVKSDGQGGLVVDMDGEPTSAPRENKARVRLDTYSVRMLLNDAFGENFSVDGIDMAEGKMVLHGKARSGFVEGVAAFFTLLSVFAGGSGEMPDSRVKVDLTVTQVDGNLHLKPSLGGQSAIEKIASGMNQRGLPATPRDGYVEVEAKCLLAKYNILSARITPAGLMVETTTDPASIAEKPPHADYHRR
jgi:hypothetical protein